MRDYRPALHRVAEVLRLSGESPDPGVTKLAAQLVYGARDVLTLQAVAAGCIKLLADALEKNKCPTESNSRQLELYSNTEKTLTTPTSGATASEKEGRSTR